MSAYAINPLLSHKGFALPGTWQPGERRGVGNSLNSFRDNISEQKRLDESKGGIEEAGPDKTHTGGLTISISDPALRLREASALFKNDKINAQKREDTSLTLAEGVSYFKDKGVDYLELGEGDDAKRIKLDENVLLSFDEEGKPSVRKGEEALTDGGLASDGENQILIRKSQVDVQAGKNATVLNLAGGGWFKGGENVTYLGEYSGAVINGGGGSTYSGIFTNTSVTDSGESLYSGVFQNSTVQGNGSFGGAFINCTLSGGGSFGGLFDNCTISAGDGDDSFGGKFSGTSIHAGGGKDIFSGTFLAGCQLYGGEGNDTFSGYFADSSLYGENGDDVFGGSMDLTQSSLQIGFYRSLVNGGAGNDKFSGAAQESIIDMGDGNDEVKGVFIKSDVKVGQGDDKLSALYARDSVFDAALGDPLDEAGESNGKDGGESRDDISERLYNVDYESLLKTSFQEKAAGYVSSKIPLARAERPDQADEDDEEETMEERIANAASETRLQSAGKELIENYLAEDGGRQEAAVTRAERRAGTYGQAFEPRHSSRGLYI